MQLFSPIIVYFFILLCKDSQSLCTSVHVCTYYIDLSFDLLRVGSALVYMYDWNLYTVIQKKYVKL